jgi:DNA-binding NarL/FixJ family response regulator
MRLLIVDDHPLLHEVLGAVARSVLAPAQLRFARRLEEALACADDAEAPDFALLDLGLPGCNDLDALHAFRARFPQARIAVVSATEDRELILRALRSGAAGYIPKTHAPPLIAAALRVIAEGGTYVPPEALTADPNSRHELTGRQLDVLRLIAKGLANKEIAHRLRITRETVKQHAKAVYAALGIGGRGQAARAAERRGIKLD